jgi:hypothetical protein
VKHTRQNSMLAIESWTGRGGTAPAKSGEPAAIPAGQVARLGQGAHLRTTATGVEAGNGRRGGAPAARHGGRGGSGENGGDARCWATSDLGRCSRV